MSLISNSEEFIVLTSKLFNYALLVYVVSSWIPRFKESRVYLELDKFFSVLLDPIRRVIPPIGGAIDISPMILFIGSGIFFELLLKIF